MQSEFSRLRVLIIDDDRFTRQLLRRVLGVLGVDRVVECEDGTQGLLILRHGIDVVITDFAMQPMDGLEFCRRVRAGEHQVDRRVPILMVTGHADLDTVTAARDAGVTEMLAKPVSVKAVQTRLAALVQRPRAFVVADDYAGPDRRRRAVDLPAGADRRQDS